MSEIRLTTRFVNNKGKIVSYGGIYLKDGSQLRLSVLGTWIEAKTGAIENVIALGNPTLPPFHKEYGYYPCQESELVKMRIRGINGFQVSKLPKAEAYPHLKK